jgi:hypothetical protein
MSRKRYTGDLFVPVVPEEQLHPVFNHVRTSKAAEPTRLMMQEVFCGFPDKDGNFIEQFQTTGFDARTFELYLYAYLTRSGYDLARGYARPDFIVTRNQVTIAIEATTVNPREPRPIIIPPTPPTPLSPEELKEKRDNELPIRFGSPLFSKLQKRYWELEHCKELPFVIAIEAFHEQNSLQYTDSSLAQYLYGLRSFPTWTEAGHLIVEHTEIEAHRHGEKIIPSNFFGQPDTEHVSAVLFSNSGTSPKFARMGHQAGYHRGNISMIRRGICYNPEQNSAVPLTFVYDLDDPPGEESWGQGLVVFHNPKARHPLPRYYFVNAVVHYFEDGVLKTEVAGFAPFASMTFILLRDDPALDPNGKASESIQSLLKAEFDALGLFRHPNTDMTSEEKEWFASLDRRVVGAVVRDRIDNDWLYVLWARDAEGNFQADDLQINIDTRETARHRLLEAMENWLKKPKIWVLSL